MVVIDAKNTIVGRFCTKAAKLAIQGNKVTIINCREAVLTGDPVSIKKSYKQKKDRGTYKGPIYFTQASRFIKRTVRGMLPYKTPKGRTAYDNITCYSTIPANLKEEAISIKEGSISKLPNLKYIYIKDLLTHLGARTK